MYLLLNVMLLFAVNVIVTLTCLLLIVVIFCIVTVWLCRRESIAMPNIPSLKNNITQPSRQKIKDRIYEINSEPFHLEDTYDTEEWVQFELYKERVDVGPEMDHDYDMYCSTPSDSESDCEADITDKELIVTLRQVPHGYIINSTVYLTEHQWNTLIFIDVTLVRCAVCNMCTGSPLCATHVRGAAHRRELAACPPLQRYDLSITRKIKNKYHCGVCNELFDENDEVAHYGSKLHEEKQLFAINKASDLIYDEGINNKKNDYFYFNANSITDNASNSTYDYNNDYINYQHDYSNDFDYMDEHIPTNMGTSYAAMAKKPQVKIEKFLDVDLGDKKVNIRYDSYHMVVKTKANQIYCMICKDYEHMRLKVEHCSNETHLKKLKKCTVICEYEEYFIRRVDHRLYHCGHCNNLQLINDMKDHIENNHKKKLKVLTEYPTRTETPTKLINDKLENRIIDSAPTPPVKSTNNDNGKTNNLTGPPLQYNTSNRSTPVSVFEKRINDDNLVTNSGASTPTKIDNHIIKQINDSPQKAQIKQTNEISFNDSIKNNYISKLTIFEKIIICPFGVNLNIAIMSYNIVCKRQDDYYCGLCDMICKDEYILSHIYGITHIRMMQRTPFILHFSNNLIRAIREALHCAICNMPIAARNIYIHIQEPHHLAAVDIAFGKIEYLHPKIAPIGIKVDKVTGEAVNVAKTVRSQLQFNDKSVINHNKGVNDYNTPTFNDNKEVVNDNKGEDNDSKEVVNDNKEVFNDNKGEVNDNKGEVNDNKGMVNDNKGVVNDNKGVVNSNKEVVNDNSVVVNDNRGAPTDIKGVFNDNEEAINDNKREINYNEIVNNAIENFNFIESDNAIGYNVTATKDVPSDTILFNDYKEFDNDFNDLNNATLKNNYDLEVDSVDLNATLDSNEDIPFDLEETVYLKLKNSYMKIANTSYNTLVHIGDGSRYCFVCSTQIESPELQRHADSRSHLKNLEKYRFLDKYENHLLRQIYLNYHCCICNVIITRKHLKSHLVWPTHALQNDTTLKNIKKTRKSEIKGGTKQIVIFTQKENIYLNEKEPSITVLLHANIKKSKDDTTHNIYSKKMNKIIIFQDAVLKLKWDNWHGICLVKNRHKCLLCLRDLKTFEIESHCNGEWHKMALDRQFYKRYAPALIRKINDTTLNCLMCNTELSNKEYLILEHIKGKKHIRNYDEVLAESRNTKTDTYNDCNDDVLILEDRRLL